MTDDGWITVPLAITTDERHGGRWVSLRTRRREWLWKNRDPAVVAARSAVVPGDSFVDAGGVEECLPTIRGLPDHGDAWSRQWALNPASVNVPEVGRLVRTITSSEDAVELRYVLSGKPGTPFLHAAHALLDVGPAARLVIPAVRSVVVLDPEPRRQPWSSGLDRLGPDDGTATCALIEHCRKATVVDGGDALSLAWSAPGHDEQCSLLLWRNLGGWPAGSPYRSIGIEPMVGRAADLSVADLADCAQIGPDGRHVWRLRLSARERS